MKTIYVGIAEAVVSHPQFQLLQHNISKLMSDQTKLDSDIAAITTAFTDVISELKAQVAAASAAGTPVPLDFTKADALVASIQAEDKADAPPSVTTITPVPQS